MIGLRQKILLLLVDSYIETRVAGADDPGKNDDDEGEWESDEDWEEEGDEEGSMDPRPESAYSSGTRCTASTWVTRTSSKSRSLSTIWSSSAERRTS